MPNFPIGNLWKQKHSTEAEPKLSGSLPLATILTGFLFSRKPGSLAPRLLNILSFGQHHNGSSQVSKFLRIGLLSHVFQHTEYMTRVIVWSLGPLFLFKYDVTSIKRDASSPIQH